MSAVTTPTLNIYQGDDVTIQHTVYQADGVTAQDITGWSMAATLYKGVGDLDTPVVTKTVGSGITLVTPGAGRADIALARADTLALARGWYQLSIARVSAGAYAELTLVPVQLLGP